MRVVFFGSPAFAVPTLAALVEAPEITVVGVVTQPDRPRGRGQKVTPGPVKRYAESHGLPVLQPARLADPGVREALGALGADLGIVAAYGKILPAWLLAQPGRRSAQRACVVAAGVSRRGAGASGDHGRRAHDRRHDHARRPRTRCRPDARPRHRADRRRDHQRRARSRAGARRCRAPRAGARPAASRSGGRSGPGPRRAPPTRPRSPATMPRWTGGARRRPSTIRSAASTPGPMPRSPAPAVASSPIAAWCPTCPTDAAPGTVVATSAHGIDVAAGNGRVLRLLTLQLEGGRPLEAAAFQAGRGLAVGEVCGP